jgi:hypothetical protein
MRRDPHILCLRHILCETIYSAAMSRLQQNNTTYSATFMLYGDVESQGIRITQPNHRGFYHRRLSTTSAVDVATQNCTSRPVSLYSGKYPRYWRLTHHIYISTRLVVAASLVYSESRLLSASNFGIQWSWNYLQFYGIY